MTADQLNLRHLRATLAVIRHGSVSAAAAEVALSQPALTQGLAKLEAALGTSLFERRHDGMLVTEAGRIIGARVEAAAAFLQEGMRVLRRRQGARGFQRADLLLTMTQIRALVATAREGSFAGAARACGVSQPAIHGAIRDTERLCGLALVERRGRGIVLTSAGARLARAGRLALGELGSALDEIAALGGERRGRIAIGAMPLARAWLLPTAIARHHAEAPDMRFDVAEGSHAELIEPLRDGEFDVLVGAIREPSPGPDVVQEALFDDRLAIFGRAGHPLAGTQPDVAGLAQQPWLAPREGTPLRSRWEEIFTSAGVPLPAVRIECGSVMMLRGLMLEGHHLTLLSPDQLWLELRSGLLCEIAPAPAPAHRTIGLTTRAGWRPTDAQESFLATLRACSAVSALQETQ
ncbi:LysR family transcriptional regulator [Sphingomonas desiccabilis]|uniref:LysR family transcriptional regulator n=1 Tax=Sphingomonas desiccabilis TaxID=429134 RepID=A0A4Q2IV15_9SPHN|nr:LysR family transcriptional regulator [Sphingomonas desiccabilis]MBB3911167.1 DNA-binding transcriptional LysR family regulator [Sphingomonas desiccabilis]RXZ32029.1 LysR family transcriptional regulator [Sphingomonas desiccabilis]